MGWFGPPKGARTADHPSSKLTLPSTTEEAEERALGELRALLAERGVVDTVDRADLLRFLRARKLNVSKAADFLQADLDWRRENGVDARRDEDAEVVLGCDPAQLQAVLPHCLKGTDKSGRPIIFKHFGAQCELRKLLAHTTLDKLQDYNWYINEQYSRRLRELGADKWVVIIDAKGWYPALADVFAFKVLKSMANTDSDHYPERLGSITVINAPMSISIVWKVVRAWLDEDTRVKVDIISSGDQKRARERLLSIADPSELPLQYGGTSAPLKAWPEWPARSGLPAVGESATS